MDAEKKISVVDLFAGAGGFSLGAKNAGARLVFAVEIDKNAATTYSDNLSDESDDTPIVYNTNISDLSADELAKKHFTNGQECDLLLGGPPCQGFSKHRLNDAGVNDPRNNLINEYFKFVAGLKPKIFLMENVPGMLWPRHSKYVEQFYAQARDHEYQIFQPVQIDARDFGVPQRRKRVFILGLRSDINADGLIWPPRPTHAQHASDGLLPWISCSEAFSPTYEGDPNNIHMKHGPELTKAFHNTPHNGGSRRDSGRTLPCHTAHDGHKDVYGRINPCDPAPTMTTACINPSKGRFVHPTRDHGITARQAARIQTFPDTYKFSGGLISIGQQIGNAVPVKLASALVEHIVQTLLR